LRFVPSERRQSRRSRLLPSSGSSRIVMTTSGHDEFDGAPREDELPLH